MEDPSADAQDVEIADAEYSTELVPSAGAPPATLFRTDDPVEIVQKATTIADVLSDVLKQRKLTNRIGDKDYVRVEGWTLCGTMLGVFPVVEWTRQIENGWEARVEARTRDGAVVGAAEAECLRTEKRWKTADDYSVRSMAQTRAISKALRAPLGFIVALAGYETTPEEEMAQEPERPFDPDRDLLPGALHGEDAPARLNAALMGFDPSVDWQKVISLIVQSRYGKAERRGLEGQELQDFWRRLSNAVQWITEHAAQEGDFPPVAGETLVAGLTFAFGPVEFELAYKPKPDPPTARDDDPAPLSEEQVQQVDAALAESDDVPFGED